jgi:hypothetical protein
VSEIWGLTFQNTVFSDRYFVADGPISTFAITCSRFFSMSTDLMTPTSTALYLILVLPASRPDPSSKSSVMVGPRLVIWS